MANESSDPITAAMIETEKEVAGFAWDNEETEALDATGDRSLEDQGDGLEGQHEPEEDVEAGDETGDEQTPAEIAAAEAAQAAAAKDGKTENPDGRTEPGGRVPSAVHRQTAERARLAETERDTLKAALEKSQAESNARMELVMKEIAALKTAPRADVKAPEPPKPAQRPDLFENPDGVFEYMDNGVQQAVAPLVNEIKNMRVENSMAIAHVVHKDVFEKAFDAVNKLNPQNPDDRVIVQRIYSSPNPGEALVTWHKRTQTLAEVGDDPAAFREKVRKEIRESLMKDPEVRKQLVAELRGEANTGDNGAPRTATRLPRSLNGAQGSNVGTDRADPNAFDGSPQAIAESAWR